jgi:hypothetical protein
LGTNVAVKGPIVAADYRFDSFLYRPSGVAMVELAQGVNAEAHRIAANIAKLPVLVRKD